MGAQFLGTFDKYESNIFRMKNMYVNTRIWN